MDGIGGQMKTFCKLTAQSPAASYVPLPRFLLQDEALRDISNDAKVLYALLLDSVCPQYISRSLLCRWFRRAVLPQQPKLEQSILSPKKLCRSSSPPAESKVRPQTAVWCRQFRGEKPLNCKHSRTAEST